MFLLRETYLSLHDFERRFEKSDLAIGEIDRGTTVCGEQLALHEGPLVASVLAGWVVCFGGDGGPVCAAGLGDLDVGFEEVLMFGPEGDGRHVGGGGVFGD